jgi:hypothetical protein
VIPRRLRGRNDRSDSNQNPERWRRGCGIRARDPELNVTSHLLIFTQSLPLPVLIIAYALEAEPRLQFDDATGKAPCCSPEIWIVE